MPTSQSVGIENDRERAQRHCTCRDHGAKAKADHWVKYAGGDRKAQSVVDKGEKEILANVGHCRPAQFDRGDDAL